MTNRAFLSELYHQLETALEVQNSMSVTSREYSLVMNRIHNIVEEIERLEADIQEQSL